MKLLQTSLLVVAALLVAGLAFLYSGAFNVAADKPHWSITARLMEIARDRSIAAGARDVGTPPALDDPALRAMGAGHYAEMCTGCHLAPGAPDTEIRKGLHPAPPNLAEHTNRRSPAELFWVIKHGVKLTGMPAWGLTHDDRSIWGMVAFLQQLPELSPAQYEKLVAQGREAGHGHGDGEAAHPHGDAPTPAHDSDDAHAH